MLNLTNFEGKKEEEVLEKALNDLNCKIEDIIYKIDFIEGKLFKGSKYSLNVIKKQDVKDYINNYFKELGLLMNLDIQTEILINVENVFNINLISNNNAILIGKDGKTLNSIQNVLRHTIKSIIGLSLKINVDISNYKTNKLNNLEKEIKILAQEVIDSKIDVSLDPMNSYERRYIHTIIDKYDCLQTVSVGEEKERHIVIKYIEK